MFPFFIFFGLIVLFSSPLDIVILVYIKIKKVYPNTDYLSVYTVQGSTCQLKKNYLLPTFYTLKDITKTRDVTDLYGTSCFTPCI